MKKFIYLMISLITVSIYGQEGTLPVYNNSVGLKDFEFITLTGNEFEWSKIQGVFYQFDDIRLEGSTVDGSNYLFDKWENKAVVISGEKKYKFNNINLNVRMQRFESKFEDDSLFVFNMNTQMKIYVNNKAYKKIYNPEKGHDIIYESIFSSDKYSFLKSYDIKVTQGSPNPMLNRSKTKIKKVETFFIQKKGNALKEVKLKKKEVLKALSSDKAKIAQLDNYMSENKRSYKSEKDLVSLIRFAESLIN